MAVDATREVFRMGRFHLPMLLNIFHLTHTHFVLGSSLLLCKFIMRITCLFQCVLLGIRTLHVLTRYTIFLYDIRHGGINNESISWDKRGSASYYIELVFEMAALLIDLMHHLHMVSWSTWLPIRIIITLSLVLQLFWSNIFLSMASLVIIMQLRYLVHELVRNQIKLHYRSVLIVCLSFYLQQRKYKRHRNYLWVLNHMEKSYPLATQDDLNHNSDNCAICWEKMETARKLPCGHLFHK